MAYSLTIQLCMFVAFWCTVVAVTYGPEPIQITTSDKDRHLAGKHATWTRLGEDVREQDLSRIKVDQACMKPIDTPLPERPLTIGYSVQPLLLTDDSPYIGWLDVLASLVEPKAEHVCAAHRAGVRILANPNYVDSRQNIAALMQNWTNSTALSEFQTDLETFMTAVGVDGFAHDLEVEMERGSPMYRGYVEVVKRSSNAMHNLAPNGLVLVAVAWSPDAIDGRLYDYVSLARSAYLFVMAYDMASQIWFRCTAQSNAPFYAVQKGLNRYLDLGIAPHKLILGTGWYGREYECTNPLSEGLDMEYCTYPEYPWREAVCSDEHAKELGFRFTNRIAHGQAGVVTSKPRWDTTAGQHYLNLVTTKNASSSELVIKQLWYADTRSLELQYNMAINKLGLGGLGMWTPNSLSWDSELDAAGSERMVAALSQFAGPGLDKQD